MTPLESLFLALWIHGLACGGWLGAHVEHARNKITRSRIASGE